MSILEELQKENNELKAHCERLKEKMGFTYMLLTACALKYNAATKETAADILLTFQDTPKQSLNEIKAQAIEGAIEGTTWRLVEDDVTDLDMILISDLREYANNLRGK